MGVSLLLAKAFGVYFIVMGLAFIFNRAYYLEAATEMVRHKGLNFTTSFITLILGVILVLFHNVWVSNWRVIITLLAWITLIKGVVRLFIPDHLENVVSIYKNTALFYIIMVIIIALGIYLSFMGFCS